MIYYLIGLPLIIIPLIAAKVFHQQLTLKEVLLACIAPVVVSAIIVMGGKYSQMSDVQILNGKVTGKSREEVSCEHSYQCNCSTDSKGNRHCSTCYEHSYDVDWVVNSTVGDDTISRIDRRGLDEPPRWTNVVIGEPFAKKDTYLNYVKGARSTLFNMSKYDLANAKYVPAYPGNVFDYYRINRVVTVGVGLPYKDELNNKLNLILRDLGPSKEANIVFVVTNKGPEFAQTVTRHWLGGKKNDVLVFVGVTALPKIDWVVVNSWSKDPAVNVNLQGALRDIGDLSKVDDIVSAINMNVAKHYVRKPMSDFEYLEDTVEPSTENLIWALVIGLALSIGLTVWGVREDIFDERYKSAFPRRPNWPRRR